MENLEILFRGYFNSEDTVWLADLQCCVAEVHDDGAVRAKPFLHEHGSVA